MKLQQITRTLACTAPPNLRKIGSGVSHIINRNETKMDCQYVAAGAIRISLAVAFLFTEIALLTTLPPGLNIVASNIAWLALPCLDVETWGLFTGGLIVIVGLSAIAAGVLLVALSIFTIGSYAMAIGATITAGGLALCKEPDNSSFKGILAEQINTVANHCGSKLHTMIR